MTVHHTKAIMITEDGKEWKFTCDECSYLALYTIDSPHRGATTLQQIDAGDPDAIHLNSYYQCNKVAARYRKKKKKSDLPSYLRKQIEDIIDKSEEE